MLKGGDEHEGHKLIGLRNGRQCTCGEQIAEGRPSGEKCTFRARWRAEMPRNYDIGNRVRDPVISRRKEVMTLTITLSAALLMGTAYSFLCRYAGLRILHAAV